MIDKNKLNTIDGQNQQAKTLQDGIVAIEEQQREYDPDESLGDQIYESGIIRCNDCMIGLSEEDKNLNQKFI